jgi:hypothetical protein
VGTKQLREVLDEGLVCRDPSKRRLFKRIDARFGFTLFRRGQCCRYCPLRAAHSGMHCDDAELCIDALSNTSSFRTFRGDTAQRANLLESCYWSSGRGDEGFVDIEDHCIRGSLRLIYGGNRPGWQLYMYYVLIRSPGRPSRDADVENWALIVSSARRYRAMALPHALMHVFEEA